MNFNDLNCCPFCGCDEFYTKEYVFGAIKYAERFDGKEAHNEELYDYLNTRNYNGRVYCRNCCKFLGNKETNMLSKRVEKIFSNHPTEKGGIE